MRPLFLLILASAFSVLAFAGCPSTLQIHTDLHRPIKVYVDGTTGNNPPTVGVTVNGITPGEHHLKVVEVYTDRYGERVRKTVYSGNINVRPSVHIDARVDEGQGIAVHNTPVPCADGYNGPPSDNKAHSNNGVEDPPVAPTPVADALPPYMSDADFQTLVNTIIAAKYEVKKMDTLKAFIGTSHVSTDQVRQVMALFSFESNKLDVAKLLYDHTVDPKKYASLASSFNFKAQQDEFKKFLKGRP